MPNRAQTETLGFVLVFALITMSIGLVYASGFTGLDDAREFEQVNNAERAFEVLASNLEDISQRNAPSRSTEIKLADASLRIAESIQIEVNDPDADFKETYDIRPVIYDPATGAEIVYSLGAVIRDQQNGGFVPRGSSYLIGENRTVLPILQTRASGATAVSGSKTILVRADQSQTRLLYTNDTPTNKFWINVTSPRALIWQEHLNDEYAVTSCTLKGDTAACSFETDRIQVTLVQIDLAIE
ncbi:MAG: hypothetical protein ABEH59_11640 [Halobacteriales archaeon]